MGLIRRIVDYFDPQPQPSIVPKIRSEAIPNWAHGGLRGWGTFAGLSVSPEQALRTSAVFACIRVLCEDISSLPLCVKKKTSAGWVDLPDHPVNELLGRGGPNPYYTSSELRERMLLDCLLYGHFANWIQRDNKGVATAIYPLRANLLTRVSPMQLNQAGLRGKQPINYLYGGVEYDGKNQFASWELWRGSLLPDSYVVDPYLGRYAITVLAREAIGLALRAEEQGARLFSNGLQTRTAIVAQGDLDTDSRKQLRQSFDPNRGSENAWNPVVLENGLDIKDIGMTPEQSQFLQTRQYQVVDIARLFRVPMTKLGVMENVSTYGAAEQQALEYTKSGIIPWTRRIEETGQRDLFRSDESALYLKHDLTHLLKADMQTRYRCWQVGVSTGFLSRNDVREFEGLDRQAGLDEFLTPTNATPVDFPDDTRPVKPNARPV